MLAPATVPRAAAALPGPSVEPDLRIHIRLEDSSLRFEVTARNPARKLNGKTFGPVEINEPYSYLGRVYRAMPELSGEGVAAHCAELALELLPEDLHRCLWDLAGQAATLWICSDELWIPWEILKLRGRAGDRWIPGPYLCEAFRVTRWRTEYPFRYELPLRRLAAVLGRDPELTELAAEKRFLEGLATAGRSVTFFPPSRREVLAAMDGQPFDAWHLACHGTWDEDDSSGAKLELGAGDSEESILLRDILLAAPNLCQHQPLIFLNACHLGRGDRGLVQWGGWIARLVEMEAGAVLAANWPIDDRAAVEFARSFYRSFLAGSSLAEAVWTARRHTRAVFPDDATWLAFTVFGHPQAVCAESAASAGPAAAELRSGAGFAVGDLSATLQEPRGGTAGFRAGGEEPRRSEPERVDRPRRRGARPRRLRWAAGAVVVNLMAFGLLASVRTDTRIQLDLAVSRVAFTAGGEKASPLIDSGLFLQDLTVARFAQAVLHPQELARRDSRGEWQPALGATGPVSLVSRDWASQITIEAYPAPEPAAGVLAIDRLWAEPGSRVVLQAQGHAHGFDLGLETALAGSLLVSVHHPFALTADFSEARGLKTGPEHAAGQPLFLRGRLREDRPRLEIFPGGRSLAISGSVRPPAEVALLRRDLPLAALELLAQDADGELRSTLTGEGRLSYPDHAEPVRLLGAGDFLVVDDLRDFRLRRLDLASQGGPLKLSLDGVVGAIRSGPRGLARDHRLTLYQKWGRGTAVSSLVAWITGWIALALGLEELWRRVAGKKKKSDPALQSGQAG